MKSRGGVAYHRRSDAGFVWIDCSFATRSLKILKQACNSTTNQRHVQATWPILKEGCKTSNVASPCRSEMLKEVGSSIVSLV